MDAPRIVSLLPAATETLFALGLGPHLVGRSHECDYPPEVALTPVCSKTKLQAKPGQSLDIHNDLKELIRQALAIYEVDPDRLRALRPNYIVTQHQCNVCAVSMADIKRALSGWLGHAPEIISLAPSTIEDIFRDILLLGNIMNAVFPAEDLVGSCLRRVNTIGAMGRDMRQKPRVACIEWIEPLMAAGFWVPQLVANAGGQPLFSQAGQHSPSISMDTLVAQDPDLLIMMPCGFDLAETRKAVHAISGNPQWQQLRAVQSGNVFITNAKQYFSRPGPRVVESLEILAEIFHPQVFEFGHAGKGWQRFFPLSQTS